MAVSSLSDEDYPDSNFGFPDFRPPSTFDHDVEAAASTDQDVQRAVVVEEKERIFNPIVGGHLNFSSNLYDEDYPVHTNDDDDAPETVPSDIYLTLVIVSVSLIVLVLLIYAIYKAVVMLKISLNDGREDSVAVGRIPSTSTSTAPTTTTSPIHNATPQMDETRLAQVVFSHNQASPPRRQVSIVTQAQQSFIQGLRSFQHPMFTSTLRRNDDDQPPPYDEPSPPPYHIAIQMRPNFDDGLKLDPIKIHDRSKPKPETSTGNDFESISLDSSDVTDGLKIEKYVSIEVVV